MRHTLLLGFIATMIGVGITAQLATGGADRDDRSGIAAICRAIASAPTTTAKRCETLAGPAHDAPRPRSTHRGDRPQRGRGAVALSNRSKPP